MATSVSCGVPCWVDGPSLTAQAPFRQFAVGTKVHDAGTTTAVQVPGGVFPGLGAMMVTTPGGMQVTVRAGYCCVPNSGSNLQGGYIFGLLASQTLTVTAADPSLTRLDLVCAYVTDAGNSTSAAYVAVIPGTPGTGAVPAAPANSTTLARLTIGAGSTAVGAADLRAFVVAPGGILPISTASNAPAAQATQLMYVVNTAQLVHGGGVAGQVQYLSVLPWSPQSATRTTSTFAGSPGALVTVMSAGCTTNGTTDIEIYLKWTAVIGSAALMTISAAIDGTVAGTVQVVSTNGATGSAGGSATFYTSGTQGNTPSAGSHVITFRFQASGSGTSTSDGILASTSSATILRVAPVMT